MLIFKINAVIVLMTLAYYLHRGQAKIKLMECFLSLSLVGSIMGIIVHSLNTVDRWEVDYIQGKNN